MTQQFILPHGGKLQNLMVSAEQAQVLRQAAVDLPSIDLTHRQECDLELLLSGAFSPLTGFMDQKTYDNVLDTLRLSDGTVWPVP
ncbi:MAG: adenylyltransferase, partial [Deltaproteobacteria bacterium]